MPNREQVPPTLWLRPIRFWVHWRALVLTSDPFRTGAAGDDNDGHLALITKAATGGTRTLNNRELRCSPR